MAGRINDDDIEAVRSRVKLDEIVSSYVMLKNAGGGSMKGLCPFHDEKTPSFQVTPSRGFFYCFGCGEGGDAISFLQKIDNLSFVEAIERLADKVGIQLRYTEDTGPRPEPGLRNRLLEANRLAAGFFADQLTSPDARAARQFLADRGFDREAAGRFGVGFAPRGGKALLHQLRGKGFTDAELVRAGLIREAGYDFFQGRLLWPIRDSGKSVVGFGARRIFDDDRVEAKYVNTPETPLYKKSHVLYGLDLARQEIGKKSQAVIVEGYTDVMAAHLSGVGTAVASCGTAFGDDHARMLRRLMGNHDAFHGEVIFTFDGDAAGQAAALRVFAGDQNFISQTYVAIEPGGLDPCDLRLQHGEAAVRELVGRRVPLYRFVMSNVLKQHDLDRADGRVSALRAAAPLVASIRDSSMVSGYARELAGLLGMDMDEVSREVRKAASRGGKPGRGGPGRTDRQDRPGAERNQQPGVPAATVDEEVVPLPDPRDRGLFVERETTKLLIQVPALFGENWEGLSQADFTHPAYAAVFAGVTQASRQAVAGLPGSAAGGGAAQSRPATSYGTDWPQRVIFASTPVGQQLVVALAVEPLLLTGQADKHYVVSYAAKLRLLRVIGQIAELKSRLQRTNPVEQTTRYNQMFSELLTLESRRQALQTKSIGEAV